MSTRRVAALVFAASLVSPAVQAQSSVTLYGVVDDSIVWQNHADPQGDTVIKMSNGAINHSRFGLTGDEDLGGGMHASFDLESGFNGYNGSMAAPGVLFDRYAWVRLSGDFGAITLGNQGTIFGFFLGNFDPLTQAVYYDSGWWYGTDVGRKANQVQYSKQWGPIAINLGYSLGGTPGSLSLGSQAGGAVTYSQGAFAAIALYQQTRNAQTDGLQQLVGAAASYTLGKAQYFVGYQYNHDNADIANSQLDFIGAPLGKSAVTRIDNGFFIGMTYQATPYLLLREAYYYDNMRNAWDNPGDNGVRWTAVTEAEYFFSKRSSVYAQLDYNHTTGAGNVMLPGGNNQTEIGVGLRHWF
jgi:predicted porin